MKRCKLILAVLALMGVLASLGLAQLNPDTRSLLLYESGLRVGEIYVPERAPAATHYLEHWVLYKNYLYPGPNFIGELLVSPLAGGTSEQNVYRDEADFFRRATFPAGSKYVKVTVDEFTSIPGRGGPQ